MARAIREASAGQDDGSVHLGQLGEALGAELGVEQEPARADGEHVGTVPHHHQGAPLGPEDPVETVPQGPAGGRHGQSVTERRALPGVHRHEWYLPGAGRSPGQRVACPARTGGPMVIERGPDRLNQGSALPDRFGHGLHPDQLDPRRPVRGRGRDHHLVESQSGRLLETAGKVGDLADLAGQPHLADRGQVGRQGHAGGGRSHGQGHGQVGGRLGDPDTTGHRGEHVQLEHGQAGMAGQNGQGHDQAAPVQPDHRPLGLGLAHGGDQGLQLDHQGAAALQGRQHDPARDAGQPVAEQEPAGVVDPVEALVPHLEQPELPGGAEPVLDRQEQSQGVVAVTLEAQHGVHHVLEGPRPGQRSVLGHVPDQHHGHLAGLGQPDQLVGALPHLRDAPGHAGGPPLAERGRTDGHRLDGVDHHQLRRRIDHGFDHRADVGGRQDQEARGNRAQPLGPQADLVGRLLGGDQQHPMPGGSPGREHLEQQGGLADARLAAEEGDRARDQATREHPVELAHAGRHGRRLGDVHRRQRHRHRREVQGVDRLDQRPELGLFHQRVPLTAGGAAPGPPGRRAPTVDATVTLCGLGHGPDGRDRVCQPG